MLSAALLIWAMTPGVADSIFGSGFDDLDGCPLGRQNVADINYLEGQAYCTLYGVDVTEWDNIWGYACTADITPFPGTAVIATILNFGKATYIAAHFQVPAGLAPNTYGWLLHDVTSYGQDLTASISPSCGDFSTMAQACLTAAISGQNLVPWAVSSPPSFCPVTPGQEYFLNVKMTEPTRPSSTCEPTEPTCAIGLKNAGNDVQGL